MKRFFYALLVLLGGNALTAQIQDYRTYQAAIHSAELKLVRGEPAVALTEYHGILTSSKGNFVKDVHNALVLANELNQADRFFELLDLLLPKNLGNAYLNDLEVFKDQHADPRWASFLATNEVTSIPDSDLKEKLEQLAIDDQSFRVKSGSYDVYGDTIRHIDSININFLRKLISEKRFPGEGIIGVRDVYGGQPVDIILHHHCQGTAVNKWKKTIADELIKEVQAGKILPNKCGLWLDMHKGDFKTGGASVLSFKVAGNQSDWYVNNWGPDEEARIEQNREILGMEPLEEYHEKIRFKLTNPNAGYLFDMQLSIFEVDQATADRLKQNMQKL